MNARTGAPRSSVLRRTGLFARLARAHRRPVRAAAVCTAVYGATWADVPGALPRYVPRVPRVVRVPKDRARRPVRPRRH